MKKLYMELTVKIISLIGLVAILLLAIKGLISVLI